MSQACDESVHFHTIRYDRIPEAFGESSLHVPGYSDAWIQIAHGTPRARDQSAPERSFGQTQLSPDSPFWDPIIRYSIRIMC